MSVLVILWPEASELRFRAWGLMLQMLGVATVWFDLTSTARKFGKRGFVRRTVDWLRAFFGQKVVIGSAGEAMAITGTRARLKQRRPTNPDAAIPDRLSTLEENIDFLDKDLDSVYQEIDKRIDEFDGRIKAESGKLDLAIRDLKSTLEDATVGNFAALAFGTVWLAIGMVLGTMAPEFAKLVDAEWRAVSWTIS
jgi:hypothetical protein